LAGAYKPAAFALQRLRSTTPLAQPVGKAPALRTPFAQASSGPADTLDIARAPAAIPSHDMKCILLIAIYFCCISAAHAEVDVQSCFPERCFVVVSGDITVSDARTLRDLRARSLRIDPVSIDHSPGGSVEAAMEIGRMLRQD